MAEDLTDVKVDVGVLKTQVELLTRLCGKMDTIIEKLVDTHDRHIAKVYVDIDERRKDTESNIKELHSRIDVVLDKMQESERRLLEKIADVHDVMQKHNNKEKETLDKILKWKWMVAGGIIVVSWLITHITPDTLVKLLK
jgi:predicted  nucleic acid-binding Zn-ribbon protein